MRVHFADGRVIEIREGVKTICRIAIDDCKVVFGHAPDGVPAKRLYYKIEYAPDGHMVAVFDRAEPFIMRPRP